MTKTSSVALGNSTLAAVKVGEHIYLVCKIDSLMSWQNHKAANKWFQKFFHKVFLAAPTGWKDLHFKGEFRLRGVSNQSLQDDSFERDVVKNPADRDKKFEAKDYAIESILVEGVLLYGIHCQGPRAQEFFNGGLSPDLPKGSKVSRK